MTIAVELKSPPHFRASLSRLSNWRQLQPGNLKRMRVLQLNGPSAFRYSLVYQNVQSSTGSIVMRAVVAPAGEACRSASRRRLTMVFSRLQGVQRIGRGAARVADGRLDRRCWRRCSRRRCCPTLSMAMLPIQRELRCRARRCLAGTRWACRSDCVARTSARRTLDPRRDGVVDDQRLVIAEVAIGQAIHQRGRQANRAGRRAGLRNAGAAPRRRR